MRFLLLFSLFVLFSSPAQAQDRVASPRGESSTQVGGSFVEGQYTGGSWVVVDYSRPILRGRTSIFGSGAEYGVAVSGGSPVWRAGANRSTRFITERALSFEGKTLPAGEYTLFLELKEGAWTLVLSNHIAKENGNDEGPGIWGAVGYEQAMDVLRAPMANATNPLSIDQFTISFADMTQNGGKLAVMWENEMATVNFSLAD